MKIRVITAVVGIIAVLGLVALGGWFLTSAVFAVSVLSLFEFKNMLSNVNIRVYRIPAVAALAIIVGAAGFYSIRIFFSAIVASFILLLFLVMVLKKRTDAWAYLYRFWRYLSGDRVRFIGISSWRE